MDAMAVIILELASNGAIGDLVVEGVQGSFARKCYE